ncbi:bifunctional 2-polyprenyl-6-hydroxyphenol methylase/3-demethylubiquinol 3-O-methyltransferase UbiG [Thiocystis violacea]|uniref:bifunctional 2-polyprenyl-6-hydroxyphenol methylase/3-demethylubiquinol 3-O-methyltransferase UbiG n=1 Tax=Thiocystis violacea TaxID=13725 RepID=UPI001904E2A6|nr:bifunctional 2-polyprenyl-6-hydroxyphenol methylase/3-demethylubiquinol 3-O-methyltransferase UbiG [Thiocystis violacea]MBK1720772.1 bifunctional 3-demethylubiquinol 3-O-methyltransferase/2-polyprenyl-6-hydroxyphenol methylase [Thiocystis violacea]
MSAVHLTAPSIDPEEVAYFERLAHRWWDTEGPFWPLHRLNAFRVDYIRERLASVLGRDPALERPFEGVSVLDIGCGGGILSESMARLGAAVTGIEITEKNVKVAQLHAQWSGLDITYRLASVDQLVREGASFDVVLNMEVIEHVEHLADFLADCRRLVRPGGLMFVASINRTPAAWLIAIVGAEYLLRWLPRGTHHYRKLVSPRQARELLGRDFRLLHETGVRVNPLNRAFHFTRWQGVNYMLLLQRNEP